MTEIWLIRHGESTANAGASTEDPNSIPLTEKGWQQARQLVEQFEKTPQLIISSGFLRTLQTAAPTRTRFYSTPHTIWPIHEFTYLDPATCIGTTAKQRKTRVQAFWARNDPNYIDGVGAESFSMMLDRTRHMLSKLSELQGFIVVFGHGQIMRAAQLIRDYPEASDELLMRYFRQAPAIPNAYILSFEI